MTLEICQIYLLPGICTIFPVGLRSTLHTSQSEISGNLSKSCHHSIPKFSNFLSQPMTFQGFTNELPPQSLTVRLCKIMFETQAFPVEKVTFQALSLLNFGRGII